MAVKGVAYLERAEFNDAGEIVLRFRVHAPKLGVFRLPVIYGPAAPDTLMTTITSAVMAAVKSAITNETGITFGVGDAVRVFGLMDVSG